MSICNGIDGIVDDELGITRIGSPPHYSCLASCTALGGRKPANFNAPRMLDRMLTQIESNWQRSPRRPQRGPSTENWRWQKRLTVNRANPSIEKQLEKGIARSTGHDWVNQVPTASGLWNETSDKLRNVDLAHRLAPGEFTLIELKVASDQPLKAIVELLYCATLYMFARLHYSPALIAAKAMLAAETIHLQVLAPESFYCEAHNLGWLREDINAALDDLTGRRRLPVVMDLALGQFPAVLIEDCQQSGFARDQCLAVLDQIVPVIW